MLLLEESVQRMEKLAKSMEELGRRVKRTEKHSRRLAEELARRVKRAERLALRKEKHARRSAEELARRAKSMERLPLNKKHGRRLAEKRAKMELPATKQFAEKEESVKMELPATVEFAEMEENLKMWRAMGEMEMEIVREELELQARRMGKPVADAGSKQGKRKRTRMVRLNQARVESAVPFRRPPYPVPPMPDWMLALAPEEIRKEELEKRAFIDKIQAIDEDFYTQYRLKGYVEVKVTEEVTDDEPGVQE